MTNRVIILKTFLTYLSPALTFPSMRSFLLSPQPEADLAQNRFQPYLQWTPGGLLFGRTGTLPEAMVSLQPGRGNSTDHEEPSLCLGSFRPLQWVEGLEDELQTQHIFEILLILLLLYVHFDFILPLGS